MAFLQFSQNSTIVAKTISLEQYIPNKYLLALVLLLSIVIISQLFVLITKHIISKIVFKTKTKIDDRILEAVTQPIAWSLITLGSRIILIPLNLTIKTTTILAHILDTFSILLLTIITWRIIAVLLDVWGKAWAKKTKSSIDDALLPLFHKISKLFIGAIGFVIIMSEWGINVTGVLAGMGIAGIALGFAVKDSLANVFGGIALLLDKAINVGDYIELDGSSGEVVEVGLRSTRIKTWDNELLIIPNGELAIKEFKNWKLPNLQARVKIPFGVAYGTDHKKVKKVVLEILKNNTKVIKEPKPMVRFEEMADFSLNFTLYFWVDNISDKWSTKEELVCKIYDALNKNKINIPFPTRTVYNIQEK